MKKIKIKLLITASFLLFTFILNVKAVNQSVDATKCEGGKAYTNYYFFLEASSVGDGTTENPGGPAKTGTSYTTQGYYKNTVPTALKTIVDTYGIFSDEFLEVAQRKQGIVPISSQDLDLDITINGVGLRTFYQLFITGLPKTHGTDEYLIEHNWARQTNQTVSNVNTTTITFGTDNITDMLNATVFLNDFSISRIEHSPDANNPTALQIIRDYSKGLVKDINTITPITLSYPDNVTRNSYLQPALYYVQYCVKTEETNPTSSTFVVKYDANGGKNAPATSATTNVGTCVNISSTKPTRSNYTFLGWSTDKNATAADTQYAANECYKGTNGDLTLYAVWKKDSVVNPGTGIASHLLTYIAVISLGAAGLLVARKKGLFRQL